MPDSFRRAMPVQQRSAVTVEAILSGSAGLLVREGLPGFNTNAVAKAAGINVATLYLTSRTRTPSCANCSIGMKGNGPTISARNWKTWRRPTFWGNGFTRWFRR